MRIKKRWVVVGLLLWTVGCSDGREAEPDRIAESGNRGVELREGRVWLRLSEVGSLAALGQLAEAGDFDLDLHAFEPRPLTLHLEGVPLAEAVAALVGGDRFAFEYAIDEETARHEIAVLHVGGSDWLRGAGALAAEKSGKASGGIDPMQDRVAESLADPERHAAEESSSRDRIDQARERARALQESLRRAEGEERRERRRAYESAGDALQQQLRQALGDPDPAVRVEALGEVELEAGDARDRIGQLGKLDPSPRVRVAAAETLGEDGTFQAVAELVGMLEDSESDVLIATLDALDHSGDESISPYIEPLSTHSDPEVREKAKEMLEFWE